MKTMRSILAVVALATGTTVLAGSEAWARDPDKETPVRFEAASTTTAAPVRELDVAQAGASALGGAGVACAVIWVFRRRPALGV